MIADLIKDDERVYEHLGGTGKLDKDGNYVPILWEDMKKLASALYLQDRISFPGLCSKRQTKELYLQSNIGIVSSNSETFGHSIVEPFVLGRCI